MFEQTEFRYRFVTPRLASGDSLVSASRSYTAGVLYFFSYFRLCNVPFTGGESPRGYNISEVGGVQHVKRVSTDSDRSDGSARPEIRNMGTINHVSGLPTLPALQRQYPTRSANRGYCGVDRIGDLRPKPRFMADLLQASVGSCSLDRLRAFVVRFNAK
ncbi:hypothetical protein J6590_095710 [Homalodisca vitripennis]|nr:hypothetical protein J6590_095710 [Homalodisca vitripennis]